MAQGLASCPQNECFVLGSRDETAGCQLCVASVNDDGTLTLRMPDGLAGLHGKYLVVPNVRFVYGHDVVLAALGSNTEYAVYRREHGEKEARVTALGQAISYRFGNYIPTLTLLPSSDWQSVGPNLLPSFLRPFPTAGKRSRLFSTKGRCCDSP